MLVIYEALLNNSNGNQKCLSELKNTDLIHGIQEFDCRPIKQLPEEGD
jgi:hypothetical protein